MKLGGKKHKSQRSAPQDVAQKPELARRRENRKSTIKSGRTIGETREKIETRNERAAARKKDKRRFRARIITVTIIFLALIVILVCLAANFVDQGREDSAPTNNSTISTPAPTIEIIDEDTAATGGKLPTRMTEYIGLAEADFKDLGYQPVRAVIPANTIREVDFYLADHPGFIKLTIDRDPALSAEDADRMLRYLAGQGVTTFEYIDVRLSGRAFWK